MSQSITTHHTRARQPARTYVTTTIPYVNARPHLGHALEFVQADVLARHHRRRGHEVRFQTGSDDNSLKNVLAAEAAGVPVQEFVDRNADAFAALREPLALSFDSFVRTSRDQRHRDGVARLWRACAAAGDFYRKHYDGLYCVGCEQFYSPAELREGRCPEHGVEPVRVAEDNWFFRLSRYQERLYDLVDTGQLRIAPESRRNEVLSFIAGGLADFSVSRSAARARGWGIGVPGTELSAPRRSGVSDQVIYVWWDALGNYVTGLDYGGDSDAYRRWWCDSDRRIHVIGKGVLRFHAVYWPAMLLSAGEPVPTDIVVHDYLTVDGQKISKSAGTAVDPVDVVARYGTDALRWWLLREVPRTGDADFTAGRLTARSDEDLANGLGNLVNRVVTMVHRYRDGRVPVAPPPPDAGLLVAACDGVAERVDAALSGYDYRSAVAAVWAIVEEANRYVDVARPWQLAKAARDDPAAAAHLDAALAVLVAACRAVAAELAPFVPDAAARVAAQCTTTDGRLPDPVPLFRRLG